MSPRLQRGLSACARRDAALAGWLRSVSETYTAAGLDIDSPFLVRAFCVRLGGGYGLEAPELMLQGRSWQTRAPHALDTTTNSGESRGVHHVAQFAFRNAGRANSQIRSIWPGISRIGPIGADSPELARPRPNSSAIGLASAKIGPSSTKLGPNSARFGQIRLGSDRHPRGSSPRLQRAPSRQRIADSGRVRPLPGAVAQALESRLVAL